MQEGEVRIDGRDDVDRPPDVIHRATARAQEHRLPHPGDVPQQRDVFEIARSDLMKRHLQFRQKVGTGKIERRRKKSDAQGVRAGLQFDVFAPAKFQCLTMLAIGCPVRDRVIVNLIVKRLGIQCPVVSLLQFDGIGTALLGHPEHLPANIEPAHVIVANLGDYIAVTFVTIDRQFSIHHDL